MLPGQTALSCPGRTIHSDPRFKSQSMQANSSVTELGPSVQLIQATEPQAY